MNEQQKFPDLYLPLFTEEDITNATGIPPSTRQMWVSRKVVCLQRSLSPGKSAGRGAKTLYSVYDTMQFFLLAELSKMTLSVKAIVECCSSEILDIIFYRLSEMASGYYHGANYDPTDRENAYERYVFLFEKDGQIFCTQEWRDWADFGRASFHTIDVIAMAAKLFTLYLKKTGKLIV